MSVSVAALLPCKTGSGIPATRSSAAVLILVLGSFRIDCRLLPHDLHPRAADARLRVSRLVHARARPRERSVAGLEPYPSSIQRGARRCGWLVSPLVLRCVRLCLCGSHHRRPHRPTARRVEVDPRPACDPEVVAALAVPAGRLAHNARPANAPSRAVLPSLFRVRHHEQHQDHPAHFSCSTDTSIRSHAVLTGYGDPAHLLYSHCSRVCSRACVSTQGLSQSSPRSDPRARTWHPPRNTSQCKRLQTK
jgi:hypothetical protein